MIDQTIESDRRRHSALFSFTAAAQILCATLTAWLSFSFWHDGQNDLAARPILWVVVLWSLAFILQMVSLWSGIKLKQTARLTRGIFLVAISLRLLFLFTPPIQEVDLYRYLWDGAVLCEGISPYQFSPEQLREVTPQSEDLKHLQQELSERPGLAVVHSRVHYPHVTTVYPPVSQCVFAFTAFLIPADATAMQHVVAMKFAIMLFDVGTLILIMSLLRRVKLHSAWAIVYGWSPLVLKEFANSGHLDSIAVFFTTLAFWFLSTPPHPRSKWTDSASAVSLALGIGAKLYPIVLVPLCCLFLWKRVGFRHAMNWAVLSMTVLLITLAPMFIRQIGPPAEKPQQAGLETFLSRWEMNDLIFMVLEENIRPDPPPDTHRVAWFAIIPNQLRVTSVQTIARWTGVKSNRVPFLVTRAATSVFFIALALWIAYRTTPEIDQLLAASFLTVAWFWLLSPTQNPWYWTWALPFAAFHRNRAWLVIAAVAMIYYCRFWFDYHPRQLVWLGHTYQGVSIFDYTIVWLEFAPALALIAICNWRMRRTQKGSVQPESDA